MNEIVGVHGVFYEDAGTPGSLSIVANSATGSDITLGVWRPTPTPGTIVPLLVASASSVSTTVPFVGPSLFDGTATLAGGVLTGVTSPTVSGTATAGTLSDGTASLSAGVLTGVKTAAVSGAVTAGSLSDGTALLSGGALTGVKTASVSGTVVAGTLSDGTAAMSRGALTGLKSLTVAGPVTGTVVTGTSLTDGTARMTGGYVEATGLVLGGPHGATGTSLVSMDAKGNLTFAFWDAAKAAYVMKQTFKP